MERRMFDTPVLPRLATILAEVKSGDLLIPMFQRPFVWDDERRLSLLDSIANGMPIGSLLVWRTNRRDLQAYAEVGDITVAGARDGIEKVSYLIDGHQRISTLFGALYPGDRESSMSDEDDSRRPLFYELGGTKRPGFRALPRRASVPENWLPLDILLDGDKLFDFTQGLRENGRRDLAKDAEKLANIFRDYIIPIVPLVTEDLDVVTDAFVRINSQGKGMTEAHMLRALTHLKNNDTALHFEQVRDRLEPFGWGELDDQVLVNVLKAELGLNVYSSSVRGLLEKLKESSTPLTGLADVLVAAVEVLNKVGVRGPAALPYTYQLVTLAVIAAQSPGTLGAPLAERRLRDWFWITTYTEHFSGTTGRRIRDSIDALTHELENGHVAPNPDLAPISPLTEIRMSSVRTQAFLLFLAQLPQDVLVRQRLQERLGTGYVAAVPRLLANAPGGAPGNRVIADPAELRMLRAAIQSGQELLPGVADEFGIPEEALKELPDQNAFLAARGRWLAAQEKAFIESFGLTVSDGK